MNSNEAGNTLTNLIFASYCVTGSLGSNHCNVNVSRRNNLLEVNVEAVSEHKHIACFEVRLDVVLVESSLLLVVDKNHNDVSLFCSFGSCIYFKALCLCFSP